MLNGLAAVAAPLGIGEPGADLEAWRRRCGTGWRPTGTGAWWCSTMSPTWTGCGRFVPAAGQCQVVITSTGCRRRARRAGAGGCVHRGRSAGVPGPAHQPARSSRGAAAGGGAGVPAAGAGPGGGGDRRPAPGLSGLPGPAARPAGARTCSSARRGSRTRTASPRPSCWPWTRWPLPTRPGCAAGLDHVVALLSTAGVSRALLYAAGQAGPAPRDPVPRTAGRAAAGIDEALGQLARRVAADLQRR